MFTELQLQRGDKRKPTNIVHDERIRKRLATRLLGQRTQALITSQAASLTIGTAPNAPPSNTNVNPEASPSSYHSKRLQDTNGLSYAKIRQIIFSISMVKLTRYRQTPDPSLARSVLICNTLKRLEKELEKEGFKISFGPGGVSFVPPAISSDSVPTSSSELMVSDDNSDDEYIDPITDDESCVAKPDGADSEKSSYLDIDSFPSGRVTPFLRNSIEDNEDVYSFHDKTLTESAIPQSALWNLEEPSERLSSLNWSSVLSFNTSSSTAESTQNNVTSSSKTPASYSITESKTSTLHTLMPPSSPTTTSSETLTASPCQTRANLKSHRLSFHSNPSSCTSSSSSYNSGSTNDEIFGDIDVSLYDFDLLSPPPLTPPNVTLAPVGHHNKCAC